MLQLKNILLVSCLLFLIVSCSEDDYTDNLLENSLDIEVSYNINVLEPSGLVFDFQDSVLYTISDNSGDIYKLSTKGNIIKTYSFGGDDLEGVSIYKEDKLLLAEERSKQLIEYNLSTGSSVSHYINYQNTSANYGIEGVAYKANDGTTFILNEKEPGKMLRLRADFSIIAEYDLNFASDYSGICYDESTNNLWIVSDQSKTINRCTLMGALIDKYSIRINQAEGIAVTNDKIYIVSDPESTLYVYEKP